MKTGFLYLNVVGKSDPSAPDPSHYLGWSLRFKGSYTAFKGVMSHSLVIVHCGGLIQSALWPEADDHLAYNGGGWDIGAHQYAAGILKDVFDYVICAATPVYLRQPGFIKAMVNAVQKYGDGLYGPMGSLEHYPHIRTCCWAFCPETFLKYPMTVDTRDKTFQAESGQNRITQWYEDNGYPVYMVSADGCYPIRDCRKPSNIFRRGDQSNCLVWDRHCDIYESSSNGEKELLEKLADGLYP